MTGWNRMRAVLGCRAARAAGCIVAAATGANPGSGSPPAAIRFPLKLASSAKFGNYLVDGNGPHALSLRPRPACGRRQSRGLQTARASASDTSSCIYLWPILRRRRQTPTVAGINVADVGEITRSSDGMKQTTYKGFPLYYFRPDANPGAIGGEAIPDWFRAARPLLHDHDAQRGREASPHRRARGASLYFFAQDTVGNPPTSALSRHRRRPDHLRGQLADLSREARRWCPATSTPRRITTFTRSKQRQPAAVRLRWPSSV